MIRILTAAITSLFITSAALALPVIGQPAPEFNALDAISGKPFALSDAKGKMVVLEWHNPECPFIRKFYSVGAMQQMQANAAKDGIVWVSINSASPGKEGYLADAASARAAIAESKSHTAHYLLDADGKIGHTYGAKTTPHMFVIDRKGTLVYMGAMDDKPTADSADIASATNYVTLALKSVKDGTPLKTSSTRSYGCFVKY